MPRLADLMNHPTEPSPPVIPKATKEIILSLDIATKVGWAVSESIYGLWDLSIKKDESGGMKLIRFRSKLREFFKEHQVTLVVFERAAGRFASAVAHQSRLQGILEAELIDYNIQYRAYSATEIKKFATGKGNSGKPQMIIAAKEKYGYNGKDDNEADALHLLHLAKRDYKDLL
jgi:Holliday junction resolvasome RuvABC endonuclease subunit